MEVLYYGCVWVCKYSWQMSSYTPPWYIDHLIARINTGIVAVTVLWPIPYVSSGIRDVYILSCPWRNGKTCDKQFGSCVNLIGFPAILTQINSIHTGISIFLVDVQTQIRYRSLDFFNNKIWHMIVVCLCAYLPLVLLYITIAPIWRPLWSIEAMWLSFQEDFKKTFQSFEWPPQGFKWP